MPRRCKHPGCSKQASFGLVNDKKPRWCGEHKEEGAVNVKHNTCKHAGCSKQPSFGLENDKEPRWCGEHKAEGAVDVVSRHCEHPGCGKPPTYALGDETQPLWCAEHKAEGAVDVVSKVCDHPGCQKHPVFAPKGEKALWCAEHKEEGDVNVVNKHCDHPGCQTRACYGFPGHGLSRCGKKEHRLPGMMTQPGKRCGAKGCSKPALYGTSRPTNCLEHRQGDERNLVHERCKACGLPDLLDLKTSLCGDCAPETQQRAYLVKQRAVKAALDLSPHKDYAGYDQMVDKGVCGKERPDFRWDCNTHGVMGEVDENGHGGYPEECECIRMVNMAQALGYPVHFVRINPDSYRPKGGKKRIQGDSHAKRMDILMRHLTEMRAVGPHQRPEGQGRGFCTMTRLYFDGWTPAVLSEVTVILALGG